MLPTAQPALRATYHVGCGDLGTGRACAKSNGFSCLLGALSEGLQSRGTATAMQPDLRQGPQDGRGNGSPTPARPATSPRDHRAPSQQLPPLSSGKAPAEPRPHSPGRLDLVQAPLRMWWRARPARTSPPAWTVCPSFLQGVAPGRVTLCEPLRNPVVWFGHKSCRDKKAGFTQEPLSWGHRASATRTRGSRPSQAVPPHPDTPLTQASSRCLLPGAWATPETLTKQAIPHQALTWKLHACLGPQSLLHLFLSVSGLSQAITGLGVPWRPWGWDKRVSPSGGGPSQSRRSNLGALRGPHRCDPGGYRGHPEACGIQLRLVGSDRPRGRSPVGRPWPPVPS